jgi:hypothetical protein
MQDQTPYYRPNISDRRRDQEEFQVFMAEVLTIDHERKVCTLRDLHTNVSYQGVQLFPAHHSSYEGTDVNMPEVGSRCAAAHVASNAGFFNVVILSWITSDTNRAQQGIAIRAIDSKEMQGWNQRVRGSYRKAYPGQRTVTNSHGYSDRQDDGWDRLSADLSRHQLDPDRRTWTQTTSRSVYNDAVTSLPATEFHVLWR